MRFAHVRALALASQQQDKDIVTVSSDTEVIDEDDKKLKRGTPDVSQYSETESDTRCR